MGKAELPGSERRPVAGANRRGRVAADSLVHFDVILRRGSSRPVSAGHLGPPSRGEYAEVAGATEEDVEVVSSALTAAGVVVDATNRATRTVQAHGTARDVEAFFDVELADYEQDGRHYRGREGTIHIPAELVGRVEGVLGLDERPQARSRSGSVADAGSTPSSRADDSEGNAPPGPVAAAGVWVHDVMGLYEFPDGDGSGQTIAVIELGGGYAESDLDAYFAHIRTPRPQVRAVRAGGANTPGSGADQEVALDLQVAGTVAPAATLVVYFADPSDRGFVRALGTAIHSTEPATTVVSISWGAFEESWTDQGRNAIGALLEDADALGVTVLASAGDHGAGDKGGDGQPHVDFPASHPLVVACGGTTIVSSAGEVLRETVWNNNDGWAGGGGVSRIYPKPTWQSVTVPELPQPAPAGRGVPDVAAHADRQKGYLILVNGQWAAIGGCSAVAPLYAGLVALLGQRLGRHFGCLTRTLYALADTYPSTVFNGVADGDNAVPVSIFGPATPGYQATAGWNACVGFGSINGRGLLAALGSPPPARSETDTELHTSSHAAR